MSIGYAIALKLATGSTIARDWVDQTMSYQLIQMTSFAKHPRLVEYNAEALVWIYCSCLLLSCDCWLSTQRASAESLARRQNAVVSTYVNDIVLLSLSPSTNCCSLLIVMTSSLLLTAISIICADIITAVTSSCTATVHLLFRCVQSNKTLLCRLLKQLLRFDSSTENITC
ncbi:hypothetical protein F511_29241 [Dorcoceras hygrometricum]|uniref:Uncharacterized protein n=1 Tax=Dorcoceras hygrometricum TaxID=472368 RepID=A0A2Z7B4G6_9LAMI|nr:hypothetical protein F511_29241 [Dorcoceras hygrometricum]